MRTLLAISLPLAALLAGEFWQDKPSSDWSDKDVKRLLAPSP